MSLLRLRPLQHQFRRCRAVHTAASSINKDEIAHFNKLAQNWWDEHGGLKHLHQMNPARMRFIRDKLLEVARDEDPNTPINPSDALRGLDILDAGCGGGLLSESLARMGANTLGVDAAESNIGIATAHALADPGLSSLTYKHGAVENLLEEPKQYDVVCSMEVLEHVDSPKQFISTLCQLVKPGGHLFLSTISRTPLAYALVILAAEDILREVPKGTHTYSKFIKASELVQFFRDNELSSSRPWISTPGHIPRKEADVRGLIYNPILSTWHIPPRDTWGALEANYIFWVRKPKD